MFIPFAIFSFIAFVASALFSAWLFIAAPEVLASPTRRYGEIFGMGDLVRLILRAGAVVFCLPLMLTLVATTFLSLPIVLFVAYMSVSPNAFQTAWDNYVDTLVELRQWFLEWVPAFMRTGLV